MSELQISQPNYSILGANQQQFTPAPASTVLNAIQGQQQILNQAPVQQAQAQGMQLDNALKKIQTVNQLAGSVMMNPTQDTWSAIRNQAQNAGLDVSSFAPDIQSALPAIKAAYMSSGQAMQMYQAQLQAQALGIKNTTEMAGANATSANAGLPLPFGGNNMPSFPGSPSANMNSMSAQGISGSQVNPVSQATQTMMGGNSSMPQTAPQAGGSSAVPNNILTTPNAAQIGPSALKASEGQESAWQSYKDSLAKNDAGYLQNQQTFDNLRQAIMANNKTGPALGGLQNLTDSGQKINNLGAQLNLNATAALTSSGISRLDLPIVKQIQQLAPSTEKTQSNNLMELNRAQTISEMAHATAQVVPVLDAMGIHDPNKALQISQNAIKATGALASDGSLNMTKFNTWTQHLPTDVMQKMGVQPAPYKDINGNPITQDMIDTMSQTKGIPPEQVINQYGLHPVQSSAMNGPVTNAQAFVQQLSPQTMKVAGALALNETSGSQNAYNAVTPSSQGPAIGKYQVLAANVRPWTKEALGTSLTPTQFKANPVAQEITAHYRVDNMLKNGKSPQDIASIWNSGKPLAQAMNTVDPANGMSVPQYVNRFNNNLSGLNQGS